MTGHPALTRIPWQAWRDRAACREVDGELFFAHDTRAAVAVCGTCTVIADCRVWALANPGERGIWAGLTERQRRKLRKRAAA